MAFSVASCLSVTVIRNSYVPVSGIKLATGIKATSELKDALAFISKNLQVECFEFSQVPSVMQLLVLSGKKGCEESFLH